MKVPNVEHNSGQQALLGMKRSQTREALFFFSRIFQGNQKEKQDIDSFIQSFIQCSGCCGVLPRPISPCARSIDH